MPEPRKFSELVEKIAERERAFPGIIADLQEQIDGLEARVAALEGKREEATNA